MNKFKSSVRLTTALSTLGLATPVTGGGGSPPYPAPPGYRWLRETYQGQQVLYNNQPCFYLERAA